MNLSYVLYNITLWTVASIYTALMVCVATVVSMARHWALAYNCWKVLNDSLLLSYQRVRILIWSLVGPNTKIAMVLRGQLYITSSSVPRHLTLSCWYNVRFAAIYAITSSITIFTLLSTTTRMSLCNDCIQGKLFHGYVSFATIAFRNLIDLRIDADLVTKVLVMKVFRKVRHG